MINFLLLAIINLFFLEYANAANSFLNLEKLEEIQAGIEPPSDETQDIKQLKDIVAQRTPEMCEKASQQAAFSAKNFYGPYVGILTEQQFSIVENLLGDVLWENDFYIIKYKLQHPVRQRPYLRDPPVVMACPGDHLSPGSSFPSGHASGARILALVLSEIFPQLTPKFMKRSEELAKSRLILGVHFPSDIDAGFAVAEKVFSLMKKTEKFRSEISKIQKLLTNQSGPNKQITPLFNHITPLFKHITSRFNHAPRFGARIGIYGCLHGDENMAIKVANAMKSFGATHLIGNGDFGSLNLDNILRSMAKITGIAKDNTYLMPGNWDYETLRKDMGSVFSPYGHLIAPNYSESGVIEIAGKKIKVAHFPQQPIPKGFLPPDNFLYTYYNGQAHTIATMARRQPIPKDIDLNVYGHTHVRARFYDINTGKLTINAGGLTDRKLDTEKRSFAIYDTLKETVEFYSVEEEKPTLLDIVSIHLPGAKSSIHGNKIIRMTLSSYGAYDLNDFAICELNETRKSEFLIKYLNYTNEKLDLTPQNRDEKAVRFHVKRSLFEDDEVGLKRKKRSTNPEFPNYFQELVENGNTQKAHYLINKALLSIINRIQIPHVSSNEINMGRFFNKAEILINDIFPGARIYISGEIIQSLLGYIYYKVYTGHQKSSPELTEVVLNKIIQGKNKNGENKEIPSFLAFGIGNNLEILIDFPADAPQDEGKMKMINDFLNSASLKAVSQKINPKLIKAIAPIKMVARDYQEYLERLRSSKNGTLDQYTLLLGRYYPESKENHAILEKFILGQYDFYSDDKSYVSTVRGLGAGFEIPFLQLSSESYFKMQKELSDLLLDSQRKLPFSNEIYNEFRKVILNSRFEGAHNQFCSFYPDPTPDQVINNLVSEISEVTKIVEYEGMSGGYGTNKTTRLVPEFTERRNLRNREDKCNLSQHGLLMKREEFLKEYSDHGLFYHGTKEIENLLAVMRNSFVMSDALQGRAAAGRGIYTTKSRGEARSYGLPFSFTLKDADLRIVDYSQVKSHSAFSHIPSDKLSRYLAEQCEVDIITRLSYALFQNMNAIHLPKNIHEIILSHADRAGLLNAHGRGINYDYEALFDYSMFHQLGKFLKIKGLPDDETLYSALIKILKSSDSHHHNDAVTALTRFEFPPTNVISQIVELLADPTLKTRDSAEQILERVKLSEEIQSNLITLLKDQRNDGDISGRAANILSKALPHSVLQETLLLVIENDQRHEVVDIAARLLSKIPNNCDINQKLFDILKHSSNKHSRHAAIKVLQYAPPTAHLDEIGTALLEYVHDREIGFAAAKILSKIDPECENTQRAIIEKINQGKISSELLSAVGLFKYGNEEIKKQLESAIYKQLRGANDHMCLAYGFAHELIGILLAIETTSIDCDALMSIMNRFELVNDINNLLRKLKPKCKRLDLYLIYEFRSSLSFRINALTWLKIIKPEHETYLNSFWAHIQSNRLSQEKINELINTLSPQIAESPGIAAPASFAVPPVIAKSPEFVERCISKGGSFSPTRQACNCKDYADFDPMKMTCIENPRFPGQGKVVKDSEVGNRKIFTPISIRAAY